MSSGYYSRYQKGRIKQPKNWTKELTDALYCNKLLDLFLETTKYTFLLLYSNICCHRSLHSEFFCYWIQFTNYFGIVLLFSTLVIFKKISVKDDFAPSRCFNLLLTATNTVTAEHKFFCVFMVYIIMYWVLYYYLYFILVLNRLWYVY